eukprot:5924177-Prymnesium_polylepis.1
MVAAMLVRVAGVPTAKVRQLGWSAGLAARQVKAGQVAAKVAAVKVAASGEVMAEVATAVEWAAAMVVEERAVAERGGAM